MLEIELAIGFVLLLALFVLGIPVFVCFIIVLVGLLVLFIGPAAYGMFSNSLFATSTTESLTTIPLFLLMGEILFRSGSVSVLLTSVDKIVGGLRGRQYIVVIVLSTVLGALSGSGIAVAAMLSGSILPEMVRRGYDAKLSAGTIMAGAMLAPIIPPSLLAVLIGTLANVSIGDLLVAGIIPGLILAVMFASAILIKVRLNPALAPDEQVVERTTIERLIAVAQMLPFCVVIFFVMGLLVLGIATPSESAATGVAAAMCVAAWYRRLTFTMLVSAFGRAASLSAVILIIIASAILFGQILAFTGVIQQATSNLADLDINRWLVFALLLLIPFVLCMFLDQIGVMMILIPIYDPIIAVLGFPDVWFWLIFLIFMSVGGITPPLGYILFAVAAAYPAIRVRQLFGAALLPVCVTLTVVLLLSIFPTLVTLLPSMLRH